MYPPEAGYKCQVMAHRVQERKVSKVSWNERAEAADKDHIGAVGCVERIVRDHRSKRKPLHNLANTSLTVSGPAIFFVEAEDEIVALKIVDDAVNAAVASNWIH